MALVGRPICVLAGMTKPLESGQSLVTMRSKVTVFVGTVSECWTGVFYWEED